MVLLILRRLLAGLGSRRELMLENLALRHQLQVALRTNPHPRLWPRDRALWVWLQGVWPDGWRQHLRVVRPETVIRWHRKGWRLYWTWRSRTKLGRPHLSPEVRALIARISKENPLWGEYDLLVVTEFPDDKSGWSTIIKTAALGNVRTKTLTALPIKDFYQMVDEAVGAVAARRWRPIRLVTG